MVLKLYDYPTSTCTLRLAVVLKEKNVPIELHLVDLAKGEYKTSGFISHQPFGQVPYIDGDGRYDPSVSGLAWELKFTSWYGGKTDEARVKSLHAQLKAKLDAYEVILAKQKYLVGEIRAAEVTLANLFHLPYGTILLGDDININEFSSRPSVSRCWNDISSRASWQAVKGGIA